MLERHWDKLTEITGYQFDVYSPDFTLGNILQAPLVKHKRNVEVTRYFPGWLILKTCVDRLVFARQSHIHYLLTPYNI